MLNAELAAERGRASSTTGTGHFFRFASLAALAVAMAAGAASAQEGPAAVQPAPADKPVTMQSTEPVQGEPGSVAATEEGGLTDIVVTARKVSENLQTVPVSITAFTAEDLQNHTAFTIRDVSEFTPGFTARQSPSNPTGFILAIRGQVQTDILATLEPSVGTYVDGFYWSRAYGLNADLLDINSFQVLKGPQGTLFGRNTTGGALVITSNDPDLTETSVGGQYTFGNYALSYGNVVLNLPLVNDMIALRAAGQFGHRSGTVTDIVSGEKYDNRDTLQGRVKLLFNFSPVEIVLSGEWYDFSSNGPSRIGQFCRQPATKPPFGSTCRTYANLFPVPGFSNIDSYYNRVLGAEDEVALSELPYTRVTTQTYLGTATVDTGIGDFKLIGGQRQISSYSTIDLDGTPYAIHNTTGQQDLSQWSVEGQLTGKSANNRITYVVGALYFAENGYDKSSTVALPKLNPNNSLFQGDIDNTSWGVYGQSSWNFYENFTFTGGLRYSEDSKGITVYNRNQNCNTGAVACSFAGAVPPSCAKSRSDTYGAWSYLLGLDWQVTDEVMTYIKYSKGYRAGGQNLRATSDLTFVPFGPEFTYEGEIGLKSEFWDRRARFNIALWRNHIDGAQRSTLRGVSPVTFTIIENAAKVKNWGLEADLTAQLFEGFTGTITGALVYPKYVDFTEAPSPQNPTGDRRNERFDGITNETFTISGNYEKDLGVTNMNLWAGLSWFSDSALAPWNNPLDPNNQAIIDATTRPAGFVIDARLAFGFRDNMFNIAAWVRNLNDNRDFVSSLFVDPFGYASGVRREPRTFGLTATVNWR